MSPWLHTLGEMETREKAIAILGNEVQLLENRIKDGNAKTTEQKLRVEESQKALKIVEESKAGKEAFDKVEAHLADLRQKEQQRRVVEQEIAGLEKEALRLSQLLGHERAEIEKNRQTAGYGTGEDKHCSHGTAAGCASVPLWLPVCRSCAKRLRRSGGSAPCWKVAGKAFWKARRNWPRGSAPFFRSSAATLPVLRPAMFSVPALQSWICQSSDLDEKLNQLALQLKDAETAEKELNSRAIRLQELDKQAAGLEERRNKNRERTAGLDTIAKQQTEAARLVEARKTDLKDFADLDAAIAKAEQERLQHQSAKDAYTANLNVARDLDNRLQHLVKMQRLLEELTGEITAKTGGTG